MSSSLPAKIDLFGDHPLTIWLAKSLARRGWTIDITALTPADYPWLGLAYDLLQPMGHTVPVWPLKWSFQHLEILYRPEHKYALSPWSADLLDLRAFQQEALPPLCQGESGGLKIQVNFCNCQQTSHQAYSGVLKLTQPVGLLECYESEQDALCLSAMDSSQVAYTYLWQEQDLFNERLSILYPDLDLNRSQRVTQTTCSCWPRLIPDSRRVILQLCRPALSPQNMILQGLGWSLLASLIRWLSLENLNAEQVSVRLSESINKSSKTA